VAALADEAVKASRARATTAAEEIHLHGTISSLPVVSVDRFPYRNFRYATSVLGNVGVFLEKKGGAS
jgi:roadblock/LC7 domain-containing protein